MPDGLTDLLQKELNQLDARLQEINIRRQAIQNLLSTYSSGRIPKVENGNKVVQMPAPESGENLSTLDMARQVIEKHGEMKADQIMEAIREEFAVKPAHTLPQMLYIRARAKKRFYRTSEGKFGILASNTRKKKAA